MSQSARTNEPIIDTLLEEAGYAVVYRQHHWVECLVHRAGERVVGHGVSRADALGDAVARLLPSHLGSVLLQRVLQEEAPPPRFSPDGGGQ